MVHTEFFTGHIATISRRDLLRRGAALAIAASVVGAIVNQNDIVDSGISRSSKPIVLTHSTFTEKNLTVEEVDLFNGGSLPEGMRTSIQTPGTASPQSTENPQIIK